MSLVAIVIAGSLCLDTEVDAQRERRRTGRTVMVVEVTAASTAHHDILCGGLGASPLPVSARVIEVEQGVWPHPAIELGWPTCFDLVSLGVVPGARFRIRVSVGDPADPSRRRWVRSSAPALTE